MDHLRARRMEIQPTIADDDEMDIYPFHHDVVVDGCKIEQYNFSSNTVRLSDSRYLSKEDVITLINRDFFSYKLIIIIIRFIR
jgi:hypothetical protein